MNMQKGRYTWKLSNVSTIYVRVFIQLAGMQFTYLLRSDSPTEHSQLFAVVTENASPSDPM